QCGIEIDVGRLHRSRESYPLGLVFPVGAELDVVSIGTFLEEDRQVGRWIGPEQCVGRGNLLGLSFERERSGVAAVRVVGTANECAEFPELDAEPAGSAART